MLKASFTISVVLVVCLFVGVTVVPGAGGQPVARHDVGGVTISVVGPLGSQVCRGTVSPRQVADVTEVLDVFFNRLVAVDTSEQALRAYWDFAVALEGLHVCGSLHAQELYQLMTMQYRRGLSNGFSGSTDRWCCLVSGQTNFTYFLGPVSSLLLSLRDSGLIPSSSLMTRLTFASALLSTVFPAHVLSTIFLGVDYMGPVVNSSGYAGGVLTSFGLTGKEVTQGFFYGGLPSPKLNTPKLNGFYNTFLPGIRGFTGVHFGFIEQRESYIGSALRLNVIHAE